MRELGEATAATTPDPVDEWGKESFPSSDPPSSWAGRDDAVARGRDVPDNPVGRQPSKGSFPVDCP